jgi:hypothetical protein
MVGLNIFSVISVNQVSQVLGAAMILFGCDDLK